MAANAVLVDAGPLVAVIDSDDAYHTVCLEQYEKLHCPLYTCWPAITEAAWLLRAFPNQVRALLASCQGNPYQILALNAGDLPGINRIFFEKIPRPTFPIGGCCTHVSSGTRRDNTRVYNRPKRFFCLSKRGRPASVVVAKHFLIVSVLAGS